MQDEGGGSQMRTASQLGVAIAAIVLLAFSVVLGPDTAKADDTTVATAICGSSLSLRIDSGAALTVSADGESILTQKHGAAEWTVIDARGNGQPWTIAISATDFISAAGITESTPRRIDISKVRVSSGIVTAGSGSDAAPPAVDLQMSQFQQSFISAEGAARGNFHFSPTFSWSDRFVAPNPNHRVGHDGASNPFISTMTVTVG